ncbi:MAG: LysM peptidoglycan-binding domain-containing M23 family metallopeptidase [Myxococcota bacterium]|jgi:LysM repeat protein|nr:peptidoglycan DD-metalloendopeptidase family protein [bacterium]MDP6073583.1 LysM peptidoglycan-binding domain-containing M23 family metallopeptidase [Myxococcota bacterium]MDP6242654.1 LysM peptidoglycan-binding domain-containing M23 family metallopeptidase [Myxococcota bacterium]MDP7074243.1 LysM peptidoglycan-binding domain-containing M23 family metallopeptidase [Myxococcota bacterium]MDP7299750.1 LysM peptidoglycan-binding domain-containing M23 family metallopeptidase [Myxococcota bacter
MGRVGRGFATLALLILAGACSSLPKGGTTHVVRPGENLWRISRHYGVTVDELRRANRVRDAHALQVGQQLRIPGVEKAPPSGTLGGEPRAPRERPPPGDRALALREADLRFDWPVAGSVSSGFGWRRGRRHEGIDIPAKQGAVVRAAEAGRVIYAGTLGDYGRVVIVKHAGRYSTVYAHNHRNKVRKGQFIEKGDVVCTVGRTGNARGSHLHFEVRRDRVASDPLRYLPDHRRTASR